MNDYEPKPFPEEELPYASTLWEPGVIFTDRELNLITNCQGYVANNPAGLPGHNLMIIIDKMDQLIGLMASYLTPEQIDACSQSFSEEA